MRHRRERGSGAENLEGEGVAGFVSVKKGLSVESRLGAYIL